MKNNAYLAIETVLETARILIGSLTLRPTSAHKKAARP